MPPAANLALPPITGSFSIRMTLAPLSVADIAAEKPAPPEPTTTTSTVS